MDKMTTEVTNYWLLRRRAAEDASDAKVAEHLERYIANRNERTGREWHVLRRYDTRDSGRERNEHEHWWHRALISDKTQDVRIYYPWVQECWMVA